ncbi:MAG: HU family DNA-binding protein [Dysgonamonadaceae bacterium]|jgi:predicted histone-like DNA-binding protein|nr:HU family DNA-binding protein [Dysgonamonadaceae bacterium]
MAIQFRTIERPQPGVAGGGTRKFYATPVPGREVTLEALTRAIERKSTLSGADIRAVLYAMVEQAVDGLAEGHAIRLGDLGSLRITLSSEGRNTPEEVTSSVIRRTSVIFTPGRKMQDMLRNARFQKVN